MDFAIRQHPAGAPLALDVCSLLREVFVGEGFTPRNQANEAFDAEKLAVRGTRWVAAAIAPPRPVGTVFLVDYTSSFRQITVEGELEVHLLAVARSHRRSGVAHALVKECVREARERGARCLVLSTQPMMQAAHALYEKHGFARAPERDWSRADGRHFLAFVLELASETGAT